MKRVAISNFSKMKDTVEIPLEILVGPQKILSGQKSAKVSRKKPNLKTSKSFFMKKDRNF